MPLQLTFPNPSKVAVKHSIEKSRILVLIDKGDDAIQPYCDNNKNAFMVGDDPVHIVKGVVTYYESLRVLPDCIPRLVRAFEKAAQAEAAIPHSDFAAAAIWICTAMPEKRLKSMQAIDEQVVFTQLDIIDDAEGAPVLARDTREPKMLPGTKAYIDHVASFTF